MNLDHHSLVIDCLIIWMFSVSMIYVKPHDPVIKKAFLGYSLSPLWDLTISSVVKGTILWVTEELKCFI